MCTLSVIEQPGGYRVVVNRDEKRSRPASRPPVAHVAHGVSALWPVDALAGGTWIGVSDRGVTLSVQNVNPTPPVALPASLVTRGEIVPRLIGARSAWGAAQELRRRVLDAFAPFRLVAVDGGEIVDARWDRNSLEITRRALEPACFVTSGLGDCLAIPRLGLWEQFLAEHGATAAMQDEFHKHSWPDRPEISVAMSRSDARTVSTNAVEARLGRAGWSVRMTQRDDAGIHRAELREPAHANPSLGKTIAVAARALRSDHRVAW